MGDMADWVNQECCGCRDGQACPCECHLLSGIEADWDYSEGST